MPEPNPRQPDNDEQQPGRWGSNRFIIVLLGIVIGVFLFNVFAGPSTDTVDQQLQTPSGTSKDQPADSPRP